MDAAADSRHIPPNGAVPLQTGTFTWSPTAHRPIVMGIVNAGPDSFSDGGELVSLDQQVARAMELVADGADIIDVGGESGVTDTPVTAAAHEAARVVPLVRRLAERGVCVSVDTWKPVVAAAALEAGASMINDVSGLRDVAIVDLCIERGAGLVIMHTRAAPKTKVVLHYDDVLADVAGFLAERLALAVGRGLQAEQVVLDPGPDFAKTPAQTVHTLRGLATLAPLRRPVLLAVSRKDFLGALTGRPPRERLAGTLAAIGEGLDAGATVVRAHDVGSVRDLLRVRAALRGWTDVADDLRLADYLRRQRTALGRP